ncbi:MAG: trypsin-like peptidase domain-containing protein [Actinomycetota bacterium]
MATLIGFGASPVEEPGAPPPRRAPRPVALGVALLLAIVPFGGGAMPQADLATQTETQQEEAPEPLRPLGAAEIARRVRPALYTIDTRPRDQSAFAFAQDGNSTLLVTTYQNVLATARLDFDPRFDLPSDSVHLDFGGVDIDGTRHQLVSVSHGSVTLRAQVIAAELQRDVAVLRVPGRRAILPARCPDHAVSIGERTHMFTAGPAAGATRSRDDQGVVNVFLPPDQIQTQNDLLPAGEGGPLVNRFGRAIGIASRQIEPTDVVAARDAFAFSTDIQVAFELAGLANECPEGLEIAEPDPDEAEPEGTLTRAQLAEAALPAVVSIESLVDNEPATGSGFAVYSDGVSTWIATNYHVLGDGRFLTRPSVIVRKGETTYLADIVATNQRFDMALVRVDVALPTLAVACERPARDERVAAIGSPGDYMSFDTMVENAEGILDIILEDYLPMILARDDEGVPAGFVPWFRYFVTFSFNQIGMESHPYGILHWQATTYAEDTMTFGRVIYARFRDVKHTAAIHHGNSGGPLLNMHGQVVGINYRGDRQGGRFALNAQRLFERLAAQAGIPDPCGAVPVDDEDEGGPSGRPATEPTVTPSFSPPPVGEPSPSPEPTTES